MPLTPAESLGTINGWNLYGVGLGDLACYSRFTLNQPVDWILWHRLGTLLLRFLIACIYNNTAKSVFAAILFHDMNNVSWTLFPNYGSHCHPMITNLLLLLTAGLVMLRWRPKARAQFSNRS